MAVALALLESADPTTVQQFSHTLKELSIASDVCREVPASADLVNRRTDDDVIATLQLREQTGHPGVRFQSISDEHNSELQVWLSQKPEEILAEFVIVAKTRTNPHGLWSRSEKLLVQ